MAEELEKNVYTAEGLKRLQDELAERKTTIAAEISERLNEARAQGDLSENSEYDDAKEAQAKNEARIQELVALLKNAEVLGDDEISKTKVSLGCTVVVRDEETKTEETYELVNANEEDIFNNRISIESPVGAAIVGKKKGQVVEVTTPAGSFKYKVIKIGK
ncbi:MAG: transcription elongation factor GreA [Clostridia bacterium]|nr:transcription elongation factor GreA [Clostridiales bacterium]MCR5802638.1 transcription elongation factor GreA [Clostridia bacterium]